jgi:ATP-dependent Clp protease adaptor protein ClpS
MKTLKLEKRLSPLVVPLPKANEGSGHQDDSGQDRQGVVELDHRVDHPKMYRVMLLNDDFTPMDFVVLVLRRFFGKNEDEATAVMLDVHKKGAGTAGVYTLEMAEMKVMQVNQFGRMNQHPLKSVLEPE